MTKKANDENDFMAAFDEELPDPKHISKTRDEFLDYLKTPARGNVDERQAVALEIIAETLVDIRSHLLKPRR